MKRNKGFTLIELLVVIAIIAMLLSILMPSLGKAKKLAQNVICKTRLRATGMYFNLYAIDNNGFTKQSGTGSGSQWKDIIKIYQLASNKKSNTYVCPTATKSLAEGATRPFHAWNKSPEKVLLGEPAVSYTLNRWIYGHPAGGSNGAMPYESRWAKPEGAIGYADNAPLLADGLNDSGYPKHTDDPLHYYDEHKQNPGQITGNDMGTGNAGYMQNFTADRHPHAMINFVFLDWSTRGVRVRDLWKLKWHKDFELGFDPTFPDKDNTDIGYNID